MILALALATAVPCASAQSGFPLKPVTLVVPFPPGSPLDTLARVVADRLNESWRGPVVVENKPGASATIGTAAVARAAPDGHMLLFTIDLPITMAPAVFDNLPYTPSRDLAPVAMIGVTSGVLFVNAGLGIGTLQNLIDKARALPGKLTYASAGTGAPAHFAGELFRQAAKIDIVHVPYKGSAQAVTDIMSGAVSMMFGPVGQALPLAQRGAVRLIAATGPARTDLLPEVPTFSEAGYPEVSFQTWYAAFAPARTPPALVEQIARDLGLAVRDPSVVQKMRGAGIDLALQGPAELARTVADDIAKWARVAAAAKIRAE